MLLLFQGIDYTLPSPIEINLPSFIMCREVKVSSLDMIPPLESRFPPESEQALIKGVT
jgi:hypothetical protein